VLDPSAPVHYPPLSADRNRDGPLYFESFTWFGANRNGRRGCSTLPNRRAGGFFLPDPVQERKDPDARLPLDPTQPSQPIR